MAFHFSWEFAFGLLGNIISFMVCLAPMPTFHQIWRNKTSEGFQSIPYVIALFSAMLWLFYAIFQKDTTLLITINSFTLLMETIYITIYLLYASNKDKIFTAKLLFVFNVLGFGLVSLLTFFLTNGEKRVQVLGWICMLFALCVFVAPLFILRQVIKTKSVEFMPFSLSFFLTSSAVMWFMYGYLKKDNFVAIPNIIGFLFGIIQMIVYMIYRNKKKTLVVEEPTKVIQLSRARIVDVSQINQETITSNDDPNAVMGNAQV